MCGSKGKIFSSIAIHHSHHSPPTTIIDSFNAAYNRPEVMEDPDRDSSVSDCESCVSGGGGSSSDRHGYYNHQSNDPLKSDRLVRLDEDERVHGLIKQKFLSCLGARTKVVAIHRNNWTNSFTAQAKVQSFQIHRRSMMGIDGLRSDDGCLKFAWFGTSKEGVNRIITHGFGVSELEQNNGVYGRGIYLSPDDSPLDSVEADAIDDDGTRHLMLCRVLLGKPEVVRPGSVLQSHPTSQEFQSGVDSLSSPTKYIVWSTNMNTHILPEYVVSFKSDNHPLSLSKATTTSGGRGGGILSKKMKPTSPWMPFPALIQALSDLLPLKSVHLIAKYHKEYRDRRVQRKQLIQLLRQLAGDELLMRVIKSWRSTQDQREAFDLNV